MNYGSVSLSDVEAWVDCFFYVMNHQFVFIGYHFSLLDCLYAGCTMGLIGMVIYKIFMPYTRGRR